MAESLRTHARTHSVYIRTSLQRQQCARLLLPLPATPRSKRYFCLGWSAGLAPWAGPTAPERRTREARASAAAAAAAVVIHPGGVC